VRTVSIGPGKSSGGNVRDSTCEAGTSEAATRHLFGLGEKSRFIDGQDFTIPHDHLSID
jgi:hypothetical protein